MQKQFDIYVPKKEQFIIQRFTKKFEEVITSSTTINPEPRIINLKQTCSDNIEK